MKPDPEMKRVGRGAYRCVVCGRPLNEVTVKTRDPFCSVVCCNSYFGVVIPTNPSKRGTPVGSSS